MKIESAQLLKSISEFRGSVDIDVELERAGRGRDTVVIVLDDDPTGIQTVHDVMVFTEWSLGLISEAFERESLFFISINTRAIGEADAVTINREIMHTCIALSKRTGRRFSIISRSDSTLRGHFPAETAALRDVFEKETGQKVHGEIIAPCFFEGGRYTCNDIHYAKEGRYFIPAGETEYAKDPVFGYRNSDLKDYIEEKTKGEYPGKGVVSIPIDFLRQENLEALRAILLSIDGFQKVIVNAMCYKDLEIFMIAVLDAERSGKRFIFRTAASWVKTYGFVGNRRLLQKHDLFDMPPGEKNGVLTVVGSYIKKSSNQLNELLQCNSVKGIEIDVGKILKGGSERKGEIEEKSRKIDEAIVSFINPVLYTSRRVKRSDIGSRKENLNISKTISMAVVDIVKRMIKMPSCIIAKGGITSSDILVRALGVRKARVMGQIIPGVSVLYLDGIKGQNDIIYVIFPGNVGDRSALADVYSVVA